MIMSMELDEVIELSESINVYNDGKVTTYSQNDKAYDQIVDGWRVLTDNVHEMPAYGVSLNSETLKAMNKGVWVEFVFDGQYYHNEMPFEKLLINVKKEWQGFNIVRYNSDAGYDGRCYYIDLVGKNMSEFYDILLDL